MQNVNLVPEDYAALLVSCYKSCKSCFMYVHLLLKQFWHLELGHKHCDYHLSDAVTLLEFFSF